MLIFIDESGNFRPFVNSVNNSGERHVTLAAIVIEDNDYSAFKKSLKLIRKNYYKYIGDKEIKSHTIRRSKPSTVNTSDYELYDFYKFGAEGEKDYYTFGKELQDLVLTTKFQIISVNADKVLTQSLYPHKDLLSTMLTDLWERICIYHYLNSPKKSRIFFDPQLNITDKILRSTYDNFCKNGSWFVSKEIIAKVNLYRYCFSPNSEDSIGIQLADYCAYPIKRHIESPNYDFFKKIIRPKLHPTIQDKKRGRYVVMGLKMTLSR